MSALPVLLSLLVLSAEPRPIAVRDAINSAIQNHPTVLTARANIHQMTGLVDQFDGAFTPTLLYRLTLGGFSAQNVTAGAGAQLSGMLDADVAVAGATRSGGRYRAGVRALNYSINSLSGLTNESLQVAPNVQFAQPLLRGRGEAPTLAPLTNAEMSRLSAESALIRSELDAAAAVAERYWEWTFQRAGVEIAQSALQQAKDALQLTQAKARAGAISALEVAQAESTVAERESDLLTAQRQVLVSEEDLLRASFLHINDVTLADRLLPSDQPVRTLPALTLADAVEEAMRHRPEIAVAEALIRGQQALVAAAQNATEYRLDAVVTAGYGFQGRSAGGGVIGTTPQIGAGLGGNLAVLPLGPFATVGVEGDLPFNRQTPRGQLEQAQAELQRRNTDLYEVRSSISVEVRTAVLQLDTDRERVIATAEAERLAAANLEAEQKKFNGGISTTFDVLRVQAELARARSNSVRALANLNTDWARARKAQGMLLEDVRAQDRAP